MRKLSFFILLLISSNFVCAQNSSALAKETAAKKRLNNLFEKEFSQLITGSTLGVPGKYASISTDSKSLSASMFFTPKSNRIFSLAVSGGATGGVAEIFDEGKLNSEVSINASYHFVIKTRDEYISLNKIEDRLIEDKMALIEQKFRREAIEIRNKKLINAAKAKLSKLNTAIKADSVALNGFNSNLLAARNAVQKKTAQDSIASVTFRLELNGFDRKVALKAANSTTADIVRTINNKEYEKNKAKTKLEVERNKMRANGINIAWVSFGYGATNKSFKLFNLIENNSFQLSSQDYTTQSLAISINRLKTADIYWKNNDKNGTIESITPHGSEYISIGAELKYTDNLSSLTKTEVIDRNIISEDPLRESVTRQNAFTGEYMEDIGQLTAFIDYYNYFDTKNSFALHLNPKYKFIEDLKPVANFKIGLLIPFKKTDNSGSTANLEVFYQIKDVFNTTENENSLLNRNVIGLQASFPFSIKK